MPAMHPPQRPRRAAAGAMLALAVLVLHALLLRAWPAQQAAPAAAPAATGAMRLVTLAAPPARPAAAVAAPAIEAAIEAAVEAARPAAVLPPRLRAAARSAQHPPPRAALPSGAVLAATAAVPDAGPSAAALPPPVYATLLPEPTSLHYRLQRGDALGSARLQWQREGGGYRLRLDSRWPGQPPAASASRGRIDADGVAPLRHSEIRQARELRAANFQRDIARITFSGPQLSYALPAGAQDRLSWMVQLGAIVAADAALRRAGAEVTLFVVGTRGDAEPWRFEVLGAEPIRLPAGEVAQALHLQREPVRPYDTRVEVWLDPARQHLPVRALLTTLPGGQPLHMELAPPPAAEQAEPADHAELENGAAAPR
mgnify:CR=1 FL=1